MHIEVPMTLDEMLRRLPRMPVVGDHEIARHESETTFHLMVVVEVRKRPRDVPIVIISAKCGVEPIAQIETWVCAERGQGITCLLCAT
jgi:hypothetical protein